VRAPQLDARRAWRQPSLTGEVSAHSRTGPFTARRIGRSSRRSRSRRASCPVGHAARHRLGYAFARSVDREALDVDPQDVYIRIVDAGPTQVPSRRVAPSAVVVVADDVTDGTICDSVFVKARHSKNRCSSMSTRSSATPRVFSSGGIVSTILTRRPALGTAADQARRS
jgi:hypothetical protein